MEPNIRFVPQAVVFFRGVIHNCNLLDGATRRFILETVLRLRHCEHSYRYGERGRHNREQE